MARRLPVGEKPFRPLDVSVLNAVLHHRPDTRGDPITTRPEPAANVIELSTPERPVAARSEATIPKTLLAIPPTSRVWISVASCGSSVGVEGLHPD